jgi:hypothetical protein
MIIEVIYLGLIKGKLDQRSANLRIKDNIRRDVRSCELNNIIAKLTMWQDTCRGVINTVAESSELVKNAKINENKEQILVQNRAEHMKFILNESINLYRDSGDGYNTGARSKRNKQGGGLMGSMMGSNRY